jgi:hypothetical protein
VLLQSSGTTHYAIEEKNVTIKIATHDLNHANCKLICTIKAWHD